MAHTSANLLVHLVFSTKHRRPLIQPNMKADVCAYLGGIVREMNGTALIVNGTTDHVHLLLRIPPVRSIAEFARVLKANSSKWIHQKWPKSEFGWQNGYGAFSVSESNARAVTEYIANQEAHHQKKSFQEEFLAFLMKNGISVDEGNLWT